MRSAPSAPADDGVSVSTCLDVQWEHGQPPSVALRGVVALVEQVAPAIIVGEEDALTPVKESRAMHSAIPGSMLEIIPKAGHVSNVERPIDFNSAMRNFLASVGH